MNMSMPSSDEPKATPPTMIGTQLRDYRIVTELGAGGMGIVYYAEHTVIGRRAAIKVLNPLYASHDAVVQRFFTEARAVNAIRHPNIVDVTDFGRDACGYFIIMEFLQGETIGSRLERIKRFEEPAALETLAQVASAVGAANAMGIVHRDLKPENIFLTNHPDYPDFVKVLDFGIVKLNSNKANVTAPGMVIGTPSYMSPEQWMGDSTLDHRSDIYSLSVVAYEMLTGQLPFAGDTMAQMTGHLQQEPRPLRLHAPWLSPAVEALIMRGLAKRSDDRFASMAEFREAIKAILEPKAPSPLPMPPPSSPSATQTMFPRPQPAATPQPSRATQAPRVSQPLTPPTPQTQYPTVGRPRPEAPTPASRAAAEKAVEQTQIAAVANKLRQILLRKLGDNTLQLPSLPSVAFKCLEMLRDPGTSFRELGTLLETDPLITARLLRVVNSAMYGARGNVASVESAVSRLGMKPLGILLQEMSAEQVFASRDPRIRHAFKGVWDHCLAVGNLSRTVANTVSGQANAVDGDTAYMAGLVHDIGKPIVAVVMLEAERALLSVVGGTWVNGNVWVASVNGCHREVGAALATRWELPDAVVDTVLNLETWDEDAPVCCRNIVRFAHAVATRDGWAASESFDLAALQRVIAEGRLLLQIDESVEEMAVQGLRARLDAVTAAATERR
jgi:putative nucleotidyltransferase with HDIG domain